MKKTVQSQRRPNLSKTYSKLGDVIMRMIRNYWELHFGEQRNSKKDCMIGAARELNCFSDHIRLREPDKSEDKAEKANVATKEAKENRISVSPATRWRRP
ncbi:hypothetical protein GW17_00047080 [Ensete ventricosum]|nr:hypothetical protein GW17_00047080 [Ensete ventricosum]RZS19150.1 hypothetical protein BHM03_00051498 [Ensete ventricosum]